VFPPGWKETVLPSVEFVKTVPVSTPDIIRTICELAGASVMVGVVEIALVEFRFATVKFAVVISPGLMVRFDGRM